MRLKGAESRVIQRGGLALIRSVFAVALTGPPGAGKTSVLNALGDALEVVP